MDISKNKGAVEGIADAVTSQYYVYALLLIGIGQKKREIEKNTVARQWTGHALNFQFEIVFLKHYGTCNG